ncbi:hypothetical protein E7T06_17975 [Deinococcus sp. Arct2-2]|uniref:hypothetical protein n=1 Tax=Deinococcus sp. Arct2-2 TaxID=2568653 RepID=UPI0010A41030|nr:hypothetical protein [Deinococcus sp. Arct2-2]THF68079.1 hypothetical protein E7T06_17975 [Deinococcus sp. Arct2-2]
MRLHSGILLAFLTLPVASSQSLSSLNAAELSALLGNFQAVTVTAPVGSKRATIRVVSQLGAANEKDSGLYQGFHSLSVYDFKTPIRLIVGLAGDPIGRGSSAAPLVLPGIQPCAPNQQLALLGASTASETNLTKQCMGMGSRAAGLGGGSEGLLKTAPRLNVWTPVYSWYFLKGNDSSQAAFAEAKNNPSARIVWWVYFSSKIDGDAPAVPLYTPKP